MTDQAAVLVHWTARVFGRDAARRVFEPLVADWRHEWQQVETPDRRGLAARWWLAFARACLATAWTTAWSPSADVPVAWPVIRAITGFGLAGTAVLMLPFVPQAATQPERAVPLLLLIVPQALGIALPFALLPGLMILGARAVGAGNRYPTRRAGALIAVAVVVTTAWVGWVVPAANQEWREWRAGSGVVRGLRELTLPELRQVRGVEAGAARQELRIRLGVAVTWPVALGVLGWRLGRRRGVESSWAMAGAWLAAAGTVAALDPLRFLGRDLPWLVLAPLWLLIAMMLPSTESRDPRPGPRYFFFGL